MIKHIFKWDNEELLEARYAHRCFWGEGDSRGMGMGMGGGADSSGPDGLGADAFGGGGGDEDKGWLDTLLSGPVRTSSAEGDADSVGDGIEASRCEAAGGVWDTNTKTCKMPGGDDDDGDGDGDEEGDTEKPEEEAKPDPYDVKYANILRDQWKEYKETYFPEEDKLLSKFADDAYGEAEAQKAKRVGLQSDNMGSALRDIQRYGIQVSPHQMAMMHTQGQQSRVGQGVQNANTTRQSMQDIRQAGMNQVVGLGHGVGGQGIGGMGQAAQMGIARNAQQQQMGIQKQYMQQQMALQHRTNLASANAAGRASRGSFGSMLGTVAGFALGGGPIGAAIGGAAGGMLFG